MSGFSSPAAEKMSSTPSDATAWGRIASLLETCKMNGVEPYAWLKSTLGKTAGGHPQSRVHEILPRAFTSASR